MRHIRKHILSLYFIILLLHCLAIYLNWEAVRVATKILLIPSLMVYLFLSAYTQRVIYTGLLFSYLGDLFLLVNSDLYFLGGMLCFIVTHICFSIYFFRLQDTQNSRLREAFIAGIVLILLSVIIFSVLNPYLGKFRIAVLIYMVFISIMSILAANTAANKALRKIAVTCFIPGTAFFVASDTLIAVNKFLYHTNWMNILVIASYGAAQCLLVFGFTRASRPILSTN